MCQFAVFVIPLIALFVGDGVTEIADILSAVFYNHCQSQSVFVTNRPICLFEEVVLCAVAIIVNIILDIGVIVFQIDTGYRCLCR